MDKKSIKKITDFMYDKKYENIDRDFLKKGEKANVRIPLEIQPGKIKEKDK